MAVFVCALYTLHYYDIINLCMITIYKYLITRPEYLVQPIKAPDYMNRRVIASYIYN